MTDYPRTCPTCKEYYSVRPTPRAAICSDGFHCCRDCTWENGRRTKQCLGCVIRGASFYTRHHREPVEVPGITETPTKNRPTLRLKELSDLVDYIQTIWPSRDLAALWNESGVWYAELLLYGSVTVTVFLNEEFEPRWELKK